MRVLLDTVLNLIMILVFGAVLLFVVTREAKATEHTFVMHCPGCDTTEPSYGSSSFENRREAAKYQPGDGRTPYYQQETNIQRDNREQMEREQRQREERSRSYDVPYGQSQNWKGYDNGVH